METILSSPSSERIIGVDGRVFRHGISGISRMLFETLKHLQEFNFSFRLYTPPKVHADFLDIYSWPKTLAVKTNYRLGVSFFGGDRVDLFWGPAHRLPFGLPKNTPKVVTVHDLVWKKYRHTMRFSGYFGERIHFARAVENADQLVCVSKSTAEDLENYFPGTMARTKIVPLAANQVALTASKIKIKYGLFVGTFEPRKNIQGILRAYACLPIQSKRQLRLRFAGRIGWGGVDIERMASDLNISNYVDIIHNPDEIELNRLYRDCHFLILPSFYEGFGLPLIEAFNHGKPAITSNCSSMPEVAGKAACLVSPDSTDQIAKAMNKLIQDVQFYRTLSSNAFTEAKKYSWESTAKSMASIFYENPISLLKA